MIGSMFSFLILVVLVTGSQCSSKPNILMILADDLGWGDTSFHGSKQIPTPNIDLLASTGIILNNFYVSPICSPSRSALMTGRYPIHTGMQVNVIGPGDPYGLPLNLTIMPQHLQRLGYRTHQVGKWHLGLHKSEYLPTRRGYNSAFGYYNAQTDYYTRITEGNVNLKNCFKTIKGFDLQEQDLPANLSLYENQYSTDIFTDRVVKLIEMNDTKPWFIYLAYQSVHVGNVKEIQPPHGSEHVYPWIKSERRREFGAMVESLDKSLGKVFRALHEQGQLDNTLIVFSTDNGGPSGGKSGLHVDGSEGSNWPLKGSKYTLWEGGVRGTAFVWSPLLRGGQINNHLMHITDILPTIYRAAGGNPTDLGNIDGIDQWKALQNSDSDQNRYRYRKQLVHNIDHTNNFWAVRQGPYKLTNGTHLSGIFDYWYVAPGQEKEHPEEGIQYDKTDTYSVLKERGIKDPKPKTIRVNCNGQPGTDTCAGGLCLFDIEKDPCELENVAKKHPDMVDKLLEIYHQYDRGYVHPLNKPSEIEADPQRHGGFWRPWRDPAK